ncbi:MAG TPA: alpha/beta hydrolase [Candidatus Avirikenella pullistercoris]|nr:alpha/beta hydrolase [Candidatus Avirikenella pullistercoris]
MNIRLQSILLFMLVASWTVAAQELNRKFYEEAESFRKSMPAGLQQRQCDAIRKAIDGNTELLDSVRKSRNGVPQLPDGILAKMVAPNLCLFCPEKPASSQRPLLLYLHGGCWAFGSINSCAAYCASVALSGDCCVAAIDYRLAPENPYPAALEDAREAFLWLKENASRLGCDSLRISVGGDSAGGNLAVAMALIPEITPQIKSLILHYPVTKVYADNSESWKKYGEGYGLDADLMEISNRAYASDVTFPYVSVAHASAGQLSGLPPTMIISAGRDILCCQGEEFARQLRDAGVRVSRYEFSSAVHLFITVPGQPSAFAEAVRLSAGFLNRH